MTKEIKFRAWSIAKNIMLYPSDKLHITCNEGYWHLENCYDYEDDGIGSKWDGDETDCILMQFIGLKDKNGKEIYEEDIVKRHFAGVYSKTGDGKDVEDKDWWDEKPVVANIQSGIWHKPNDYWVWQEIVEFEVIGNIYENPELLK